MEISNSPGLPIPTQRSHGYETNNRETTYAAQTPAGSGAAEGATATPQHTAATPSLDYRQLMMQGALRQQQDSNIHQTFRIAQLSSHARQAVQSYRETAAMDEQHVELLPRLDTYT